MFPSYQQQQAPMQAPTLFDPHQQQYYTLVPVANPSGPVPQQVPLMYQQPAFGGLQFAAVPTSAPTTTTLIASSCREMNGDAEEVDTEDHNDDPSSLSEPLGMGRAKMVHLDLDLAVDFESTRLVGRVDITCVPNTAGPCELVLDTRDLQIRQVYLVTAHPPVIPGSSAPYILQELPYELEEDRKASEADPVLGTPLRITLPPTCLAGQQLFVRVAYATSSDSSALQFLTKEQTSGGKYPFLFSQCEAIHARAMVPLQDGCNCKVTYSARIRAPTELFCLMSAIRQTSGGHRCQPPNDFGVSTTPPAFSGLWSAHTFRQDVAIPPYLIAIVCGELAGRRLGPRSTVWAEPSVVDKAQWEFEETEKILSTAEELCGPYRFGVYDLFVVPPSFPYGGMENPCLTFVTPTLLAGDRSQVDVIANEIAHSWSGNLVTNRNWEHFWLNEGMTCFIERKIVERCFGEERGALRAESGWQALTQCAERIGPDHNFTCLVPDLSSGVDPDDSFSTVPYEKGASLLWYLQELVGGHEIFQSFVQKYFNAFAGSTVTSQQFANFFMQEFKDKIPQQPDWQKLFYTPGMPEYKPPYDPQPVEAATALAVEWEKAAHNGSIPECAGVREWPSAKKCIMLNTLINDGKFEEGRYAAEVVKKMNDAYGFLNTNCEVRCDFIQLALSSGWDGAKQEAVKLVTEQGRMKFTRTLYRALAQVDPDLAKRTFEEHKLFYHPICRKMVQKDLGLESDSE
ncbi:hypothetical protein FOL47_005607 [Perkinsus chesapeaki]|uniref:Peptidase M1 leukotriene A4 hydrolase/aminopeptidase C-terminal domain-containing protein n=1 Tax=Perkinsus chesapeaki TaxID=330153 RepID=A0A7J6MYW2_PERCH|nr:hypothetical protein FOL47_005607 [Perkinsus chesapeaki]